MSWHSDCGAQCLIRVQHIHVHKQNACLAKTMDTAAQHVGPNSQHRPCDCNLMAPGAVQQCFNGSSAFSCECLGDRQDLQEILGSCQAPQVLRARKQRDTPKQSKQSPVLAEVYETLTLLHEGLKGRRVERRYNLETLQLNDILSLQIYKDIVQW